MNYYILTGVISFAVGFLIAFLIFKKKNNDYAIYSMLNEFKNSIDEYKNQTILNTKEINYIKQYTTQNSEDKQIKPDYLIKLPNNKSILIDCKLNLEKYI